VRYSRLFGKTLRRAPKEAETISHQLLTRAGYIDQLASGIYSFLPLGWRVHRRIENIIREEMDAVGGQEVFLPALQPKSLWEKTGRWEQMDPPLFKFEDRHHKELALGSTHEEVITGLVARFVKSYKDLPLYLYQIQNKFRNEMRSTGGLLRVREFVMKDLYSFHRTEADLDKYYLEVRDAYLKVFESCGLEVKVARASGGTIGGEVTHEFHCLAETGEDKIIYCPKCDWAANVEDSSEKKCPQCASKLEVSNSIENGHIFKLGTKYSKPLGAYFIDRNGKKKPIWMGCYGLGIGRLLATIVEVHHDREGIVWPISVAPYDVHLISMDASVVGIAEELYRLLKKAGVEVLFDDRDESAGVKLKDADLVGIPVRVVVSKRSVASGGVEISRRGRKSGKVVSVDRLAVEIAGLYDGKDG